MANLTEAIRKTSLFPGAKDEYSGRTETAQTVARSGSP
jgi:hypothetical protein